MAISEAELVAAAGHFDAALRVSGDSATEQGSEWSDADQAYTVLEEDTIGFGASLDVPFRSGITVTPAVQATHTTIDSSQPLNEGDVSLTVRVRYILAKYSQDSPDRSSCHRRIYALALVR